MAKRHILFDPETPPAPKRPKQKFPTNWELCVICQESTAETLQCPQRSTKQPIGIGYVTFAEDLIRFVGLENIPLDLDLSRLDDGQGIETTLRAHAAKWHKTCRL